MCAPENWDIELQGVSVSRERSQVLKEISGRIAFGKNLGIVGPSGVGKTTLALVISGIIRPTKGEVKIGKCSPESLLGRELIYVPSQPYLFEGTIRENIALGKNITEDEIAELLKTVELGELSPDLWIEEGGRNLSLGQRQRIALARALARNPRIIILDEATSGMDSEREARILQRLRKMGMTLITISHRLSTIREMEEIWVLEEGRILCKGMHEELFKSCEKYCELFKEQEKSKNALY